ELDEVEETIRALREDRALGLFSSPEDEALYRRQMKALIARRDDLRRRPIIKSGWEIVESSETYADVWGNASMEERRKLLVDAGVTFLLYNKFKWEIVIPQDMESRLVDR